MSPPAILKSFVRTRVQVGVLSLIQLIAFMAGAQLAGVPSPNVGTTEQATIEPRPSARNPKGENLLMIHRVWRLSRATNSPCRRLRLVCFGWLRWFAC